MNDDGNNQRLFAANQIPVSTQDGMIASDLVEIF